MVEVDALTASADGSPPTVTNIPPWKRCKEGQAGGNWHPLSSSYLTTSTCVDAASWTGADD